MCSIWALMASWLTFPWLFLSFSLTILTIFLTIFITSHRKPQHQLAQPDHANPDHPPTQLARSPSLLDFNLSSVYRSDLSVPEMGSAIHSEFSPVTSSLAASSSSSVPPWDVFLSFRGKDTRNSFTAHLCAALRQKGINTFMDDRLRSGLEISPELVKAIVESQISIIVLSKSYASSRWCLDELIKILECKETGGQQVLPLFYDVDPSEVRYQTNSVGEAFTKLEKRFKNDIMKVKEWKKALKKVADLSGKHLGNRNEPEFIQEIIEWLNSILVKKTDFQVAKYPVGIEFRVQEVKSLLNMEKNDSTCIVGIFGTGGIGKTTLAKAIYNSIASRFECSCFLGDVRETSEKKGLIYLQNELLRILGCSSLMVDNVDQGITLIKQRLRCLRVLIVLDDVDQLVQLEKLAGKADWFGLGSRIIITSRDKHLLRAHGVDSVYRVNELDSNEALQLFSRHAFKSGERSDDFVELTKYVIGYARGLPLALVVMGSDLSSKDLHEWKSALDMYKRYPNKKIHEILRISYDGLEDTVKEIFLDIACFFKGKEVAYVNKILDKSGFFPDYGIKVLVDKSLISIDEVVGLISMHDLLQEVGREIVRQESPKEPGERSRLWFHKDVRDVLEGNKGTNKVEGILVDLPKSDMMIHLNSKAFKKMRRLRLFISRNACFSEELNFFSNELRLLDWSGYSGESFLSNFCGRNLVVLRMHNNNLKRLEGVQNFPNLTIMDFSRCVYLRNFPDVSRIPNLENLCLDHCKNLVEVHDSVGFLDKLVRLSFEACSNLISFPRSLKSRSLQSLNLAHCSSLKKFPNFDCQMNYLVYIRCSFSGIKELPSSIGYAVGVERLELYSCQKLKNLPDSIRHLQHLKLLSLTDSIAITDLPSSIGYLGRIESLDLSGCTNLRNVPDSIYQPQHLKFLSLSSCSKVQFPKKVEDIRQSIPSIVSVEESAISTGTKLLQELPSPNTRDSNDDYSSIVFSKLEDLNLKNRALSESNLFRTLGCFSTLGRLNLSRTDIVTLPRCFERFVGLKHLDLSECKQLREILGLPPNVVEVLARECVSLEIFLEESRSQGETVFPTQESLRGLNLSGTPIVSLPTWFNRFVGLEKLRLRDCKQLQQILGPPPNVLEVNASRCVSLEIFLEEGSRSELFNTWDPPKPVGVKTIFLAQQLLKELDLSGSSIVSVSTWFNTFVSLKLLYLRGCKQLREILGLPPSLAKLDARGCVSLEIFLEQGRRSQLINTGGPPEPVGVGTVFPAHQSLECLDLSSSAIVSLPTWFNTFVRLWCLSLKDCKQLREISELLPLNIKVVYAHGCTSLERFQINIICDLPMLEWIDLSDCPQHIRYDVQSHLFSVGHHKVREYGCIFPGNKVPNCFCHRKEVANTNSFEININEAVHLDWENTRYAFSAVIGFKERVQNELSFCIRVGVIIDGEPFFDVRKFFLNSTGSDHVWLHFQGSYSSRLKTGNLRVKFLCEDTYPRKPSDLVFFKSCGFHLQQIYEEKAIALMDGI